MKKLLSLLVSGFLTFQLVPIGAVASAQEAAKSVHSSKTAVTMLRNQEILNMVKADFTAETILFTIKSSPCSFVTTAAALQQLKDAGVPDAVILEMVMRAGGVTEAPRTAPATAGPVKTERVQIPNGLVIEVEAPFTVNSQEVRKGEAISFRVVNPVKVDGVIVIEAGATATAEVVKAERGGHFGRAGRLAWTMRDVTAIDGSRLKLQSAGRVVGDSKGAKVATAMIITGAALMIFAPIALLHGFKRGENAILPAGKRLEVLVQGEETVVAPAP